MSFILFIILVLLFAALFVVGIGLSILGQLLGGIGNAYRFVKQMLGFGKAQGGTENSNGRGQTRSGRQGDGWTGSPFGGSAKRGSAKRKEDDGKVFKQNEGEYIDFEEIK